MPRRHPPTCTCGHVLSSHRQDPVDPWVAERCKTCGCAGFDNRDDASMQSPEPDEDVAASPTATGEGEQA